MGSVNLKTIAEQAGVSLATASRVLSGSDYPVKDELRERVERVAAELDYVPNANARGLLQGRSQTVGVLVGDVSDPFFSTMIGGIHEVAAKAGYMVTVVNTYRDPGNELDVLRRLRAQRVDVMIVAASGLDDPIHSEALEKSLAAFVKGGNSAVLIGPHEVSADLSVSRIDVNNRLAARQVAEHLHELGHRRVALLAGETNLLSMADRVAGFRDVFGDELVVRRAAPTRDGGHDACVELLDSDDAGLTAIATTADQMAFGVLACLRERGISVPEQMSVTGFNDIEFARDTVPPLTSAHLPLDEVGRLAMDMGIKALDGVPSRVELTPELRVRGTTGKAE
ncbi:LacI family DNA-binding transcriptional regulator [uncultured Tessaracoccus sp.]|uniref:LacI family DNA-binding transcriptional regulator n=1 Tax=uncultured Tessaracoccus sp. TaxID=905023 RepID=UPI00262FEC38|nr:LacI family DNA-binding transcriptional regulator [uncultured Tessaracoccus sp.]